MSQTPKVTVLLTWIRVLEQFIDLKLLFTATKENHILLMNLQKTRV